MATNSTKPCPSDRSAPVSQQRSDLAALALAAGVDRDDVQAYASGRYRLRTSDIGLVEVQ